MVHHAPMAHFDRLYRLARSRSGPAAFTITILPINPPTKVPSPFAAWPREVLFPWLSSLIFVVFTDLSELRSFATAISGPLSTLLPVSAPH